jgi:hypothetical protein
LKIRVTASQTVLFDQEFLLGKADSERFKKVLAKANATDDTKIIDQWLAELIDTTLIHDAHEIEDVEFRIMPDLRSVKKKVGAK